MSAPLVLVAGSLALDTIVRGGSRVERLGGAVTHAGRTWVERGARVRALSALAAGDRGRLAELAPIEVVALDSPASTRFINHLSGERRRQELPARARPILAEELEAALEEVALLHLAPLHPDDLSPGCLPLLAGLPAVVALDAQGLARRVEGGQVVAARAPGAEDWLRSAAYLKADAEEAALLGLDSPALAAEVVWTEGSRGGSVRQRGREIAAWKPDPLVAEEDSTGAGDAFFAAYLSARALRGATPQAAASLAARIASAHVAANRS